MISERISVRSLLAACVAMIALSLCGSERATPGAQPPAPPAVGLESAATEDATPSLPAEQAKAYRVKRMKGAPTVDADWNKPAWADVTPLTLEYYMGQEPSHRPRVQAKIAYDDDFIYVIWRVEDNYVLARKTKQQESVSQDSCVEFFFTPGGDTDRIGYFNIETSCIGTMMFASNVPGIPNSVTPADIGEVAVASSLKGPIDAEITTPTTWTLEYRIPLAVLEKHSKVQRPEPGLTWRANFYKCADGSSHPHWLTWSHVDRPAPSFHAPRSFGELIFE
jgi:hypothetical protein